jgi:hypothetical protein
MKKLFTIIVLTLSSLAHSQEGNLKTVDEVKNLSKEVSLLFKENKQSEAIDKMRPFWPVSESEINTLLEQTVKYSSILEDRYGKIINQQKVKEETIKDFALKEIYFVNYEKSAIRLIFIYYKGSKGWILNSFKWDDNFTEEFK